jgi:hypothetical protein
MCTERPACKRCPTARGCCTDQGRAHGDGKEEGRRARRRKLRHARARRAGRVSHLLPSTSPSPPRRSQSAVRRPHTVEQMDCARRSEAREGRGGAAGRALQCSLLPALCSLLPVLSAGEWTSGLFAVPLSACVPPVPSLVFKCALASSVVPSSPCAVGVCSALLRCGCCCCCSGLCCAQFTPSSNLVLRATGPRQFVQRGTKQCRQTRQIHWTTASPSGTRRSLLSPCLALRRLGPPNSPAVAAPSTATPLVASPPSLRVGALTRGPAPRQGPRIRLRNLGQQRESLAFGGGRARRRCRQHRCHLLFFRRRSPAHLRA